MNVGMSDFLKEATIMHSIDHEHIVRLYGVVLNNDALMLVRLFPKILQDRHLNYGCGLFCRISHG